MKTCVNPRQSRQKGQHIVGGNTEELPPSGMLSFLTPSALPICISNPVPGHQAPSCHLCTVDTSKNNSADTSMALSQKETLKDLINIIQPVTAGLQTPVCPYPAGIGRTRAASAHWHLLWCMVHPGQRCVCGWHPGKSGSQRVRYSVIF